MIGNRVFAGTYIWAAGNGGTTGMVALESAHNCLCFVWLTHIYTRSSNLHV